MNMKWILIEGPAHFYLVWLCMNTHLRRVAGPQALVSAPHKADAYAVRRQPIAQPLGHHCLHDSTARGRHGDVEKVYPSAGKNAMRQSWQTQSAHSC